MSTPEKPPARTGGNSGLYQAQITDIKADVSEERDERREAQGGRIEDLKDRIKALEEDKDSLAAQLRWMTRMVYASFFILLIFLGVSVGVVSNGEVNVPLIGKVNVGTSAEVPDRQRRALAEDTAIEEVQP